MSGGPDMKQVIRFVYYLYDPSDPNKTPRYVGVTRNPRQRLKHHTAYVRKSGPVRLNTWLFELKAQGRGPAMTIVRSVVDSDGATKLISGTMGRSARSAEASVIKAYAAAGFPLLNRAHAARVSRPRERVATRHG